MITKLTISIKRKDLIAFLDTSEKTFMKFYEEYPYLYVHRQLTCQQDKFKSTFDFWKKKQLDKRGKRGKDKKKRENESYLGMKNALKIKKID